MGTALAEIYLGRESELGSSLPRDAALRRQAMLKMLTGDVCGTGHAFTRHGQPLAWQGTDSLQRPLELPDQLEAVWDAAGAVCLNDFRIPENQGAIAAACPGVPQCKDTELLNLGSIISLRR